MEERREGYGIEPKSSQIIFFHSYLNITDFYFIYLYPNIANDNLPTVNFQSIIRPFEGSF